ncbi:hypothetical protein [Actinopolyspora xinjiangensis]|nr:hypothetical protein [Actinopolyspora xinjiangensis]
MLVTSKATGHVGTSGPIDFTPVLREDAETPATMQMAMNVDISLEDAAAALWIVLRGGIELSALDNDRFTHEMVLETIFAEGGNAVAAARDEMNDQPAGSFEAHTAHALRSRVAALYGTGPAVAGQARQCRADRREVAR